MLGSLEVALLTSSDVIDLIVVVAVDAHVCEQRSDTGSSREQNAARASLERQVGALVS